MTTEERAGVRAWKALLVTASLAAGLWGFSWLAVQDAAVRDGDRAQVVDEAADVWSDRELEVERLPPVPSLRRPVVSTRSSR
jgi:hypothetical protein